MNLIILACLIAAPETCREEELAVSYAPIPPIACLAAAPPAIAEWSGIHPEWRVARWRCDPSERSARR